MFHIIVSINQLPARLRLINPFISLLSFCLFFFPPGPDGPEALSVFIPEALMISIISNLKAEMSFLISFTSSSVTPSFSAFLCSWVTYLRTRFLMMAFTNCWKYIFIFSLIHVIPDISNPAPSLGFPSSEMLKSRHDNEK